MEKKEVIELFASKRPDSVGVYGYGSGVFKQNTNDSGNVPQTDVIFIVDDMREWHQDNMRQNSSDYSLMGRIHFNRDSVTKLKGANKITYLSNIFDEGMYFKYGVVEVQDFLEGLNTWENFFVAGRFHKPVLEVASQDNIRESIDYNRKCALMVACLFCDSVTSIYEIYRRICSLSYCGDARMKFAENPCKVENIVNGSFDKLSMLYPLEEDYIGFKENGDVLINHQVLLDRINELPQGLLNFLNEVETDFSSLDIVRINIGTYLLIKTSVESKSQMKEGLITNGIVRSVPYALAKVKKRFGK